MTSGIPEDTILESSIIIERGLTFGRIKPRDLDNVIALRPAKLGHLFLNTKISELSHVELGIPNMNGEARMKG